MSKSYRKYPIVIQEKINKRQENKNVRHKILDCALKGGQYKKLGIESNWKYRWTLEEALKQCENGWTTKSIEEQREYWLRCTIRK